MQLIRNSRRPAALLSLALALLAAPCVWAARTQEANVLPFLAISALPTEVEDEPLQLRSDMLLGSDNNIYFGSGAGGAGAGAIGKLTPDGTLTTLYAFKDDGTEGLSVFGRLIEIDGALYGTTYLGGGEGGGTLFRVAFDGTFTVLYEFGGGTPNPLLPYTGVTLGPDGFLYGTTLIGGEDNLGVVYRVAVDGTSFSVLHSFDGNNGSRPEGALVVGNDGLLYGTTMTGGSNDRGTVYRISTAGQHEILFSFPRLGDVNQDGLATNAVGSNPRAGLMLSAIDGNLYGTTFQGGPHGYGTVFRITPEGQLTVVHGFAGGGSPLAGVIQDASGNLYGTSTSGGPLQAGSAWRVAPDGTYALLHGFIGSASEGHSPQAALLAAHGYLYAATPYSGARDRPSVAGAIVKLDLGSSGMLPVEMAVSAPVITLGENSTLSWSAPAGATCTKIANGVNAWSGDAGITGSQQVAPAPAIYIFGITCTDADDGNEATPQQVRLAYAALTVNAPLLQPVDGGGGTGALSLAWLLLTAALLFVKIRKESLRPCP